MASVTIKGLDSLTRKLNNITDMELKDTMTEALKLVHGQAKTLAPVDGGDLSESIHMSQRKTATGREGRVYTNLEYAPYVEFGTGIKGNGTYPYEVKGLTLAYKDKGWIYYNEKLEKKIFTTGQEAQPYMYPALKNNEKTILKMFKSGVKTTLTKSCKGGK